MEQSQVTEKPVYKIYKEGAILLGTFLGGPLVAGYMMATNFIQFKQPQKAKKTWTYAVIATVVSVILIFLIPKGSTIPSYSVPLMYTAMAYYLVNFFQKEAIAKHIQAAGEVFSMWNAAWVGFVGFMILVVLLSIAAFFVDFILSLLGLIF